MKLSAEGLEILKELEGFRSNTYLDRAGKPTIGFGHLIRPYDHFPSPITRELASAVLREDIAEAEDAINSLVTIPLKQNEFDALTLFVYNVGRGALKGSTTLKVINTGDRDRVPKWLMKWVYVTIEGGAKLRSDGLENRRKREVELWLGQA